MEVFLFVVVFRAGPKIYKSFEDGRPWAPSPLQFDFSIRKEQTKVLTDKTFIPGKTLVIEIGEFQIIQFQISWNLQFIVITPLDFLTNYQAVNKLEVTLRLKIY